MASKDELERQLAEALRQLDEANAALTKALAGRGVHVTAEEAARLNLESLQRQRVKILAALDANTAALIEAEMYLQWCVDNPPPVKGPGSGAVVTVAAGAATAAGAALNTGGE